MTIAIVSSGLSHVARGIETWAKDTAAALARRGVAVTLCKGSGTASQSYEQVLGCWPRHSAIVQAIDRLPRALRWRWGWGSAYQIEQTTFANHLMPFLTRHPHDLVHLQDPWLAWRLLQTQHQHHARVLYMNGTEEPLEFIRHFPCVQEQSPPYLSRHPQEPNRRRFCVPSFVDTNLFQPGDQAAGRRRYHLPPTDFLVLSVGALRRSHKRMDWLVREFANSRLADARLVLAGARENQSAGFLAEARAMLGDRLIVLDPIPHDEMWSLYQACDLFVLCSLQEIFGLAFVEAMACGLPCLGHTWPVTKWIIGAGGTCVDMEQPGALAKALSDYRSPARRAECGRLARERAVSAFSEEVVVAQMLDMYRQVLGESGNLKTESGKTT